MISLFIVECRGTVRVILNPDIIVCLNRNKEYCRIFSKYVIIKKKVVKRGRFFANRMG